MERCHRIKIILPDRYQCIAIFTRYDSYYEISQDIIRYEILQDIIIMIFQEIKPKSPEPSRANSEETQMLIKSSAPEMWTNLDKIWTNLDKIWTNQEISKRISRSSSNYLHLLCGDPYTPNLIRVFWTFCNLSWSVIEWRCCILWEWNQEHKSLSNVSLSL